MADERSIVITLKLDKSQENEANTSNQTSSSPTAQTNDKDSSGKAIATWAAVQLLSTAWQEVTAWGEYEWNKTLSLNDDYIGQRNKQIAMTQINRAINIASNVGSATAQGAMMGGWFGAIIGFTLSTVTTTAQIIRSNIQGQEQQDIMLRQMDAQLQFTRSRVGWSTQAASIGEDL